jgi:tetratricopeptide (TPR) repeat protein
MSGRLHPLEEAWKIHQQGRVVEAEQIYRGVLDANPRDPAAWCYLGIALHDRKQYHAAVDAYRKAIELKPEFPIAWNNLGNSLRYLMEVEQADQAFLRAIALQPGYANAYRNRGTLHIWNGNLELARESFQEALRCKPDDPELHRNQGILHLLKGEYPQGWEEYAWRWQCSDMRRPAYQQPLWKGAKLEGKTLLLYAEQGLGDCIHFLRYADVVRQEGARVLVHGPARLTPLLSSYPGADQWIPQSTEVELPFDLHGSLIDAAHWTGCRLGAIPATERYLAAPPGAARYWKEWFQRKFPEGFRVGLMWQGSRENQADPFRSFPLKELLPLATVRNVHWFSLQMGDGVEQLVDWQAASPLHPLPADADKARGAFVDTAGILEQLDLMVTCDSSLGHLAASMGIPTWILLGYVPDWRWMLGRDDSPWYPSVRLFRQERLGHWSSAVRNLKGALEAKVQQGAIRGRSRLIF